MSVELLINQSLKKWIDEMVVLCQATNVWICDGSDDEYKILCAELVKKGVFVPLNNKKHPNSYLARSTPDDVARVESKTFICSPLKEEAGPTNNWQDPEQMLGQLKAKFAGCMRGRTLYVIPFSMGPLGSPISQIGVQITDSAYVVCNMRIMTRMGHQVLQELGEGSFVKCMHSVGKPLKPDEVDVSWPCNPSETVIAHFPKTKDIWSFGSGYGGNALLGKKCFALRIASVMGKEHGWLAEHMLILGITNPEGRKKYIAAAFPSACGKTNLAMMNSGLPGWKIECVGDDIAWMKFGSDGKLYAINPEAGFFGVAPGTSMQSNPNALISCSRNSIFTNVALTEDGDVWWEGLTPTPPPNLTSWLNVPWDPRSKEKAAHPNSRFTAPATQCPVIDPNWENPQGVPISAIIFGGRRSTIVPLVYESFNWQHGTFLGATMCSETTAAATGDVGKLRHDPFAMLPFCGYNMADYFAHWLSFTQKKELPRIYAVNWFRKSDDGKFLWPGFGQNARVLKWIFERCDGSNNAVKTPIGFIPQSLDLSNLDISSNALAQLFSIDAREWLQDIEDHKKYFSQFGNKLPKAISEELELLAKRLTAGTSI